MVLWYVRTLPSGKEYNDKTPALVGKVLVCTFLVYVIWEIPGVFHAIFRPFTFFLGYVDPKKPDVDAMHEWFFRSGLDRYVWIYGGGHEGTRRDTRADDEAGGPLYDTSSLTRWSIGPLVH